MPLGAARLTLLAKTAAAGAAQRTAQTISAVGNTHVSRNENKFGGSSARFDGVGDYLDLSAQTIPLEGDWTFECWIRSIVIGSSDVILRIQTAADAFIGSLYVTNGKIATYIGGGGTTGTTVMSSNTWYHLAWCRDGSTIRMYINGVQDTTRSYAVDQSACNLYIGHFPGDANTRFNGYLDEMRISNTARYPDGTSFTAPTSAFVNDADTLALIHANGYGSTANTTFWDDNGDRTPIEFDYHGGTPGELDTAQKQFGTASWQSTQDYDGLTTATDGRFDALTANTAFTIECWVRRSGANPDSNECTIWDGGNQNRLYYDETAGAVKWDTEGIDRITGGDLSLNTWYHLAVVRDTSNNVKLYIDGTQSGSTYTNDDRSFVNITSIGIGLGTGGSDGFIGHIDEFRISDNQRYTTSFTPSTSAFENDSNTLMLHHFDGTDGSNDIRDDNGRT